MSETNETATVIGHILRLWLLTHIKVCIVTQIQWYIVDRQ